MLENEIWKPIVGYEGLYEVSNYGGVKSLNFNHSSREGILKLRTDTPGYLYVSLYKGDKTINHRVHRLVAKAFISNPKNKPTVNHLNGIKDDNRVENLEWETHIGQRLHAYKIGLQVVSEKQKSASKEATQIISTWINVKLNLEFRGNAYELVRAFPEQNLQPPNLSKVRTGKRLHYKGWIVKS